MSTAAAAEPAGATVNDTGSVTGVLARGAAREPPTAPAAAPLRVTALATPVRAAHAGGTAVAASAAAADGRAVATGATDRGPAAAGARDTAAPAAVRSPTAAGARETAAAASTVAAVAPGAAPASPKSCPAAIPAVAADGLVVGEGHAAQRHSAAVDQQAPAQPRPAPAAAVGRIAAVTAPGPAVGDRQVVDGDGAVVDVQDAVLTLAAEGQLDGLGTVDGHVVIAHQHLVQLDGAVGRHAENDVVGPRRPVGLRQAPAQVATRAGAHAAHVEFVADDGEGDVGVGQAGDGEGRGGEAVFEPFEGRPEAGADATDRRRRAAREEGEGHGCASPRVRVAPPGARRGPHGDRVGCRPDASG